MNKQKTCAAVNAAVLTVVSLLAGCSGSGSQTPPAASPETGKAGAAVEVGGKPLEFTFYGHYDWYTMPPWGEDAASKWIKENKKVTVTAVNSGGAAKQKLNTMIASNELPDVIWADRGAEVEKLREAGMLVAFDDYLAKYPNLKKWMGEEGLNMLRSPDGKIYQFPNWYTNQPNGNAGYIVNKKIYKELGSPKLETTDDLYVYLKAVKEKYPNVIPFETHLAKDGQGLNALYTAFGENHLYDYPGLAVRGVPRGDKLTSIFADPVFRESTQYASKLFREKLMTQDAMTQTLDQITEKIMNGNVAVFAGSSPTDIGLKAHTALKAKDPEAGYFMIWPIHKPGLDKNKIFPGTYTQLGWNVSLITKAAKDPEAIFAFLDWYTGPEGQRIQMWGPPGTYWDGVEADGITPKFTEKYATDVAGLTKLQGVTTNLMWNGNTVYIDSTKAKYENTLPEEKRNWATRWQSEIAWKTQANATEFINLRPSPDSPEGILDQTISDLFLEVRAKALFAKSDEEVTAILDKAEKDAMAAGYQKLLDYRTQKWQDNLKKMKGGK
ncbi:MULTISPECIES: extracellular solute-binding protein [Paenibacillus]|uniref:extracellular solute-binding protein n=1 Tax=Paenibacillus TaxID=44249 RepID=UPI0022B85E58|nr:extracellular solute-binding protein [Paenibacillus caseinilyticus]MCZ8523922.1 extracellular solute-binding protein [Paenibacillus caseinilyticus]